MIQPTCTKFDIPKMSTRLYWWLDLKYLKGQQEKNIKGRFTKNIWWSLQNWRRSRGFPENCFLSYLCTQGYMLVFIEGVYTEGTFFIKSVVSKFLDFKIPFWILMYIRFVKSLCILKIPNIRVYTYKYYVYLLFFLNFQILNGQTLWSDSNDTTTGRSSSLLKINLVYWVSQVNFNWWAHSCCR